ncbi:TonB-dependent receptor [Maricaulaceae bacterium NA33B04]|nr:TonB-dependent receptor [Maricaulaceae bacterium NA33B04]
MKRVVSISAVALLVALGEGPSAFAQEADDVITITAGRASGAEAGDRPVAVLTRVSLNASGLTDLGDALAFNPSVVGSEFNDDPGTQNDTSGTSSVNLRGLGLGATLVLVNGQRQTPASVAADDGASFVDLNALLPGIAIERSEILKDGASPLFGTDAVSGVVNVITRDLFEGVEAQVEARGADGLESGGFTSVASIIAGGKIAENVHLTGAISYRDGDGVEGFETDFIPGTGLSALGQPGAYYIQAPGGGFEVVTGSGGPQAILDHDCAAGGGNPLVLGADTAFGAPGFCQLDFGQFFSLVGDEARLNAFGALTADLGETTFTLRAALASQELTRGNSPSLPALSFPTIPAANPGNYFGRDVTWLGRPQGVSAGAARRSFEHDTFRIDATLERSLSFAGREWDATLTANYSRNELTATITDTVASRLDAAINGLGGEGCTGSTPGASGCQWFNPFGSGGLVTDPSDPRYNDPALVDWLIGENIRNSESTLTSLEGVVATDNAFTAPGGAASLVLGAQIRRESLDVDNGDLFNQDAFLFIVGGPDYDGARRVISGFAESVIPLSGRARLQLAVRHEDLEEFSSTDPKLALAFDVTEQLTLSGGWSRSFRAPSLHQQVSGTTTLQSLAIGAQSLFRPVRTTGSLELDPETADTFTLSAHFASESWTVRADLWRTEVEDLIVEESANAILAADFADDGIYNDPRVTTTSADDVVLVAANFVNAPSVEAQGLDLSIVRAPVQTGFGAVSGGVDAVYIDAFTLFDPVLNVEIDAVGNRNFTNFARSLPDVRATAYLDWSAGAWSARAQARHIAGYDDDENGGADIDAWTALDLQAGWSGEQLGHGVGFTVGALNITDEDAPFVDTPLGYDTKVHDARGRVLYARFTVSR